MGKAGVRTGWCWPRTPTPPGPAGRRRHRGRASRAGSVSFQPERCLPARRPHLDAEGPQALVRLERCGHPADEVTVTYWMNRLQPLNTSTDLFVTLNPPWRPEGVLRRRDYTHPVMSAESTAAQRDLPRFRASGPLALRCMDRLRLSRGRRRIRSGGWRRHRRRCAVEPSSSGGEAGLDGDLGYSDA